MQLGTDFFFSFSQLCFPLRFQSSPETRLWEGFLLCGNFSSFMTPSSGRVSIPKFVSVFIYNILPYLLSKGLGYLSGYLVSSTSVQKLFCECCSAFRWSFDEFVGEKVISPSYSSAILALSTPLTFLNTDWTSGSSWITSYWSLAWRILSITLLAYEMSATK